MTTFNWVVTALNCLPNAPEGQDYVINVHYTCNGTDGTYNASVYSTCSLPVTQGTSFIPYQDLTLDIVLGWIWANGVDKAATEAAVQTQIDNLIDPPVVTPPIPWSQA
jgi:hypothetical protein